MSRFPRCDPEATDAPDLQEWQEDAEHDASWGMRVGFVDREDWEVAMAASKEASLQREPSKQLVPAPATPTPMTWLGANLKDIGHNLGNPFVRVLWGLSFHWRDDAFHHHGTTNGTR